MTYQEYAPYPLQFEQRVSAPYWSLRGWYFYHPRLHIIVKEHDVKVYTPRYCDRHMDLSNIHKYELSLLPDGIYIGYSDKNFYSYPRIPTTIYLIDHEQPKHFEERISYLHKVVTGKTIKVAPWRYEVSSGNHLGKLIAKPKGEFTWSVDFNLVFYPNDDSIIFEIIGYTDEYVLCKNNKAIYRLPIQYTYNRHKIAGLGGPGSMLLVSFGKEKSI